MLSSAITQTYSAPLSEDSASGSATESATFDGVLPDASSGSTSSDRTSGRSSSGSSGRGKAVFSTALSDTSSESSNEDESMPTNGEINDAASSSDSDSEQVLDDFDATFAATGGSACAKIISQAEIPYSEFAQTLLDDSRDAIPDILKMLNTFCRMYEENKDIPAGQRMEFIDHSHAPLLHHPGRSSAPQPQIIAVLSSVARSWRCDPSSSIAWHHVAATVHVQLDADDDAQLLEDCETSMAALTQARPDLPGCLSMAISRSGFKLLWGDPTTILRSEDTEWAQPCMVVYALSFVHFLYLPYASDPTICLEAMSGEDLHSRRPVWLINDNKEGTYRSKAVLCVGEAPQQNWVVSASEYRPAGASEFLPCSRTILKDSWKLSRDENRSEGDVLRHIHQDGDVPGVCGLLAAFRVPIILEWVKKVVVLSRWKQRIIMDGTGKDLYSCTSALEFLMVMHDTLEVLKYLHENRDILHRDISPGNILRCTKRAAQHGLFSLKFAADIVSTKYKDVSPGPRGTLIDFDNAFWHGHTPDRALENTVGTMSYVARTVTRGFKMKHSMWNAPFIPLTGSAHECYVNACGEQTYQAISAMDIHPDSIKNSEIPKERAHFSPHHDAESCFWVIVKFLGTALPVGCTQRTNRELDDCLGMRDFGVIHDGRDSLFYLDAQEWSQLLCGDLNQFGPLLAALARAVRPVYEFCDPVPNPYHLHYALQRILLQEICRVLDDRSDVILQPCASREPDSTVNSPRSSHKRLGDYLDRQDNARRRRLS